MCIRDSPITAYCYPGVREYRTNVECFPIGGGMPPDVHTHEERSPRLEEQPLLPGFQVQGARRELAARGKEDALRLHESEPSSYYWNGSEDRLPQAVEIEQVERLPAQLAHQLKPLS